MITAEKVLNDEACQEHVFKNEWCVSKRSALKAMGEYLRLKVAESESKNLKQPDVIKSVCEHEGRKFEDGWTYCIKCTEFMY